MSCGYAHLHIRKYPWVKNSIFEKVTFYFEASVKQNILLTFKYYLQN